MVHLVLSSSKGNQGLRYFPHSGYLGLTPVKVEGVVKTKLDDDLKPLLAKSITISVKCYEVRLGRVSVVQSNVLVDHTLTLWSKPDDVDYAPIGNLDFPFKIVLPTKTAGFSTSVFVDYRCSWRVEATINHIPISGVGSRQIRHFDLPLVRYDLPPYQPTQASPPPLADLPSPSIRSPHSRSPRLQYSTNPPTDPVGPSDLVSIPIHLLPLDPTLSIRSVSASIDRRITLAPDSPSPPTSPTSNGTSTLAIPRASPSPSPRSYSPPSSYRDSSAFPNDSTLSISTADTNSTITPDSFLDSTTVPLISPHERMEAYSASSPSQPSSSHSQHHSPKVVTHAVVSTESSGNFTRDEKGVWSKILTLQWPPPKPNSRWATGETIQSELVNVQFFARFKVVISSSWSGTETVELPEKEILVVSTNASERQAANAKYSEALSGHMRSKSKSPRRKRRERDDVPPPPAPASHPRGEHSHKASTLSVPVSSSSPKSKSTPRRPHTSSGTREKGSSSHSRRPPEPKPFPRPRDDRGHELETEQPDESGVKRRATRTTDASRLTPETSPKTSNRTSAIFSPRLSFSISGSSANTSTSTSTSSTTTTAVGSLSDASSKTSTSSSDRDVRTDLSTSSSGSQAGPAGVDEIKAWEEELARIEVQSRRTSEFLGFTEKHSARIKKGLNLRRLLPVIGNGKA